MKALHYSNQVDLLLSILGNFVEHPEIALKGGTAINLFLLNRGIGPENVKNPVSVLYE